MEIYGDGDGIELPMPDIMALLDTVVIDYGQCYAWGSNKNGELGQGDRLNQRFPKRIEMDKSHHAVFTEVACGDRHSALVSSAHMMP